MKKEHWDFAEHFIEMLTSPIGWIFRQFRKQMEK
jgi:hypothetical protein